MEAGYILRTMIDHCDALDPESPDATVTIAKQSREWFEDLLRSFSMNLPTELFDGGEIIEFHLNMVGLMEARDEEGNKIDASPDFQWAAESTGKWSR